MPVRKRHIELLEPYLIGEEPRGNGEWDMYCPLHEDTKRSASLNVKEGVWYCHADCGGGRVTQLIRQRDNWVAPATAGSNGSHSRGKKKASGAKEHVSDAMVAGWHSQLMTNKRALAWLKKHRGLVPDTLRQFEIGFDGRVYTIPVRSPEGELWNVRRYHPNPGERRKIWSVSGMGSPRLYPMAVLDDEPSSIIVCEGEWDALLSIQKGYPAITRTGAADVWEAEWGQHFRDKVVYICHDMDTKGQSANRKVAQALQHVARDTRVIELPYEVVAKHGKDLTDFWLEHDRRQWKKLLRRAQGSDHHPEPTDLDPSDATVLDSFDSRRVGEPLRMTVTIKGKRDPGYSVPHVVHYSCTMDAGKKCSVCPMMAAEGEDRKTMDPSDPVVLEVIESTKLQLQDVLRRYYGAQKCTRLAIEAESHQSVEILFARPSVDHTDGSHAADYKNVKLTSVGRHDTMPNNTMQVVGALYPDPRKQTNEFQAWEVNAVRTSLDHFEVNPGAIKLMKRFRPKRGQRPLKKLGEISRAMSEHVTKIYGRPEMHAAIDLVFHSALSFDFSGQRITRGWLEVLVVGDTRTGKSEAAAQLVRHYGAGEVVSCESASFAGVVGGLQQYGGKEWAINWGAIPINDRRLVVLDEISGLSHEEISQMSDVRSSGLAKLTKIQQEVTHARTRLIWLGNPRNGRMSEYTYGVQAIRPLIGNNEDIARFDLALSVTAGEVDLGEINAYHDTDKNPYPHEACNALLRWVWSRTPDQIVWGAGAEKAVLLAASDMAKRYTEDPPLVQGADIRIKIARMAVALAARTFSTTDDYQSILVNTEHVHDAVTFMDRVYGMQGFGYAERSREHLSDREEAKEKQRDIRRFLKSQPGLAKFLRNAGSFRRQDLEEILNISREEANGIINTLWDSRMVRKEKGDVKVEPQLHEVLRGVKA